MVRPGGPSEPGEEVKSGPARSACSCGAKGGTTRPPQLVNSWVPAAWPSALAPVRARPRRLPRPSPRAARHRAPATCAGPARRLRSDLPIRRLTHSTASSQDVKPDQFQIATLPLGVWMRSTQRLSSLTSIVRTTTSSVIAAPALVKSKTESMTTTGSPGSRPRWPSAATPQGPLGTPRAASSGCE